MKVCVITGASSCGKTTLINYLQNLGFPVLHEVAREILAEGRFHPSKNAFEFQQEIAERHYIREQQLRSAQNDIIFLDRGLYDGLAFCRHFGLKAIPPRLEQKCRYDIVFFLESLLLFEQDGVRIEKNREEALNIKNYILEEYAKRNIQCVSVPAIGVKERADFVFNYLK